MPAEYEGVPIPATFTIETAPHEQVRKMYQEYCEQTPLNVVEYEVYEPFARAVLIPLSQYLEAWKQSKDESYTVKELRRVYKHVLIELISRFPATHEDELYLLRASMRCLSPLPVEVFPDEYFRRDYDRIYIVWQGRLGTPTEGLLPLEEFAAIGRAVHEISRLFESVLLEARKDISFLERPKLANQYNWAMLCEYTREN